MALLDWIIIGIIVAAPVCIGFYFTKRASRSIDDFFVAGRTLSWFVAGTSIVATTFSADTPLFIAGLSRHEGISANWFWWSSAIGHIATIFFFARLWRRTGAVTDIEFVALRYKPSLATDILRLLKVMFSGLLVNSLIMASVTLAMGKIAIGILGLSPEPFFALPLIGPITPVGTVLIILGFSVVAYSTLSGSYGVAYSGMLQFTFAMLGSIILALLVYIDACRGNGILRQLHQTEGFHPDLLKFFPSFKTFDLKFVTFMLYVTIVWWQSAPGHGFAVQKLLATRSEKDSMYAILWYNICHFIIRPWPWILVGILSIIYFPSIADSETAFPRMIGKFLPIGLKGLVVASLFAAFMSTLDTHLNLGASYFINDLYRPYIKKNKSQRHYVIASRIAQIIMIIIVMFIAARVSKILAIHKYLGVLMSGVGTVLIARWYWWRVNALAEIMALIGSVIVSTIATITIKDNVENYYTIRVVIALSTITALWVPIAILSNKKPCSQAIEFYRKMKINSPGWRRVSLETGVLPMKSEFKASFICWISGIFLIYGILIAIGKFLFWQWTAGLTAVTVALTAGIIFKKYSTKISFK